MAVKIGSARIDENGKARSGKAGDQTGKEVSTQNWYLHTKGWRVFRAKNPKQAEKIAVCMERACANDKIGYDQSQRLSLYNIAKPVDFDVSKVATNCETDCSALVRVCCAFAGITLKNFTTLSQPDTLISSGEFIELKDDKYTKKSEYLGRGDILVTKTQGHTVVVLSNGSKFEGVDGSKNPETPSINNSSNKKTVYAKSKDSSLRGTYRVTATTGLNLRYKPGNLDKDNVILSIPSNAVVHNYGYYTEVNGVKWLYVEYRGQVGFVHSSYLRKI